MKKIILLFVVLCAGLAACDQGGPDFDSYTLTIKIISDKYTAHGAADGYFLEVSTIDRYVYFTDNWHSTDTLKSKDVYEVNQTIYDAFSVGDGCDPSAW